jgi:hypothetical protein
VRAAASQASNRASHLAHAVKIAAAVGTSVDETRPITFYRERQVMTARFMADAEIAARVAPFCAMR